MLIAFIFGMFAGGYVIYKIEEEAIEKLNRECTETTRKLNEMIRDEEKFIETMWPKQRPNISLENNLTDYLRHKYLKEETEFEPDCEDESDNLYI
jgi:hypothetical protein